MKFVKSESFDKPELIDADSSPNGVYIRKSIVEETYTNPETQETKLVYRYEEAFISKEEYVNFAAASYSMEQIEIKREDAIRDEYTLGLIEEGII